MTLKVSLNIIHGQLKAKFLAVIFKITVHHEHNTWIHVTQVSLIITQVKNKIAYRSINRVKKSRYRRRVTNKQRAKVSGMCNISNSSYSAKGITENYSVQYGDAMLEPVWGNPTWRPKPAETSGVYFGSLKTFILSVTLENIRIGTSLNILVSQNSKT